MIQTKFIRSALICLGLIFSFSQIRSQESNLTKKGDPGIFEGSTPCDTAIRKMISIPLSTPCDFIRWKLQFSGNNDFKFHISYGEYLPNTPLFLNGGTSLDISGTYTIHNGSAADPKISVYDLKAEKHGSRLTLVRFDKNIFHFADYNKQLLVGNGGFGYVLNRIKE